MCEKNLAAGKNVFWELMDLEKTRVKIHRHGM